MNTLKTVKTQPFWRFGLFLAVLASPLHAKTVTATDGSQKAVQTAIDSASDGDTVQIPAGSVSWATGIEIKKPVKVLGAGNTTVIQHVGGNATMVTMIPSTKGSVEFGKVKFTRNSSSQGIYLFAADAPGKPMLVHDCTFDTAKFGNRSIDWGTNGGVIFNCSFTSLDKGDNSAIAFKNPSSDSAWKEADFMGMKDANGDKNTYVEDCTFTDIFLQAMDFDDNSRSVIRHCKFSNSAIASHGQETSAIGTRTWELYDNEFTFSNPANNNPSAAEYPLNMNHILFIRGGTGVCFNNKIPDVTSSAWGNKAEIKICLYNIRRKGQVPCQTKYPAARQMGWGADASGKFILDPMYFWGNTGGGNYDNPALSDYDPDECGNGLHTAEFVKKNREFYVGTEKPDYTPYTYPHPLRVASGGGGGSQPSPTPAPTSTPRPTATPEPTATPAPTAPPAQSFEDWIKRQNDWIRANPPVPDAD